MELEKIRGINEKRKEDLNKAGIFDTADLMRFFPRNYIDLREKRLLSFAYHNDMTLTSATVISVPPVRYYRRGGGVVKAVCEQDGLIFNVIWFNQPYVASRLKVGEEYLFFGRVRKEGLAVSVINPSFELCEKSYRLKGIIPQYQSKGNIPQKVLRDSVKLAVDIEKPHSIIPEKLIKKYNLMELYPAFREVHNPTDFNNLKIASDRIAIEEYFALISAYKIISGDKKQIRINKYNVSSEQLVKFIFNSFPFEFTGGQKDAVNEIFADMTGATVMNRLLQGDVGSGKTAVSSTAIFIAVNSGYQVAMLAPTEVLAEQNYNILKNLFPDYNVGLLVGSSSVKEKKAIKQDLASGLINIIVGTHALIQEDVVFKNLSLCICDEQQRFGVAQRSALVNKGVMPDILVMSATPIPRTLSLIFYGDLDITTIKDKPKSRLEIQTNIVPSEKYSDMLNFIKKECEEGKQAYFVCPKIEGDEEGTVMSVSEIFESLKQKLPSLSIGLLHGKMKDKDKNQILLDFKNKKYNILVSTTVIEVGIDVPNASVMVIYNAERFGLSALHQLRGRVGRSDIKSYCFLLTQSTDGVSMERLKALKNNSDGFKIAEYDFELRGAGDFMGSRQSGKSISDLGFLRFSSESIFLAKKISDEVFDYGENIEKIREFALKKYDKLKNITLN